MTLRTNRLSPEACGFQCDVDIGYEVDNVEDTVRVVAVRSLCPAHQHLPMEELFPVYKEESNRVSDIIHAAVFFSPNHWGGFSFDERRVLRAQLNATAEEKAIIQAFADLKFGGGKVVIA